ncbi:hypothetical protein EDI_272100 [Entamoeba dispar SAW760]|uniref:TLC domain-containing protein n=1 Tax=Entamoeba dispar (strain ATCC PRA-260 / SAW760) TaxID=370354 RepID=B0EFL2_ENTDS|nr:uncharacterized protein EDI_272100 [Entamoeba dispar SAW760]EDR26694.1 hypothetical protein EDI_272100 [Entamoeba dispar SAW760]|eukprot:EDR26694.1 hypothetical protein EDI_272100 [Entamoeba dispar SAW760]
MNPFVWGVLIMTPIAVWIGIYFRKWKYRSHFTVLEVILLLGCIIFSLHEDAEPHYLLGMTLLQEIILFEVSISYVIEITDFVVTLKENNQADELRTILMHTIPGYIGILYMFYVKQCGGLIVRLLLDSVSLLISELNQLVPAKYHQLLDDIYSIMFVITRVIYYSILSVYGIYIMLLHWEYIDKILFLMYCIWTIYVLYDHVYYCFWRYVRFEIVRIIKTYLFNKTKNNNVVVKQAEINNQQMESMVIHNNINNCFSVNQQNEFKKD